MGEGVPASGLPFTQPDLTDLLATDPASGRLALTAAGDLILLDSDLNVLAYGELGAFLTPERLITCGFGDSTLVSWRVDGMDLVRVATNRLAATRFPVPVPGHGDRMLLPRGRGQVWLDAETLVDQAAEERLAAHRRVIRLEDCHHGSSNSWHNAFNRP